MGFLLLPHLASRLIVVTLYNATGASVLIAGLFHAMHNAMVNPTWLGVAVLGLPQAEVLVVLSGVVVLAGVVVTAITRRRLGLPPSVLSRAGTKPGRSVSGSPSRFKARA
jgi:hypothetical protein